MNSFADSPLFFFMDNMSPIISGKASKDIRKIVELSDTGCDARLPVSKIARHINRSHSPKLTKIKQHGNWESYCPEKIENKSYGERFRVQNESDAMDTEECFFILKEDGTNQYYWQNHSPHEDFTANVEFKRSPGSKDFRTKLRASPDRLRSNSCEPDDSYGISNTFHNNPNITHENILNDIKKNNPSQSYPTRPKSAGAKLKFARSNYPNNRLDANLIDQPIIDRGMVSVKQDYSEDFISKEIPRNSPRYQKFHWQRLNMSSYNDTEDHIDEISHRNHRFSRYSSRNEKPVSSANSNKISKDWIELTPDRIRSRTWSSPIDRRKKTRCFSKNVCENLNQIGNKQDNKISNDEYSRYSRLRNTNSNRSIDKPRLFVDRAVDKDSLSDLRNVCTSTEHLSSSTIFDTLSNQVEKSNIKSSFWDFIPLDDKNDGKCKEVSENKKIGYPYQQHVPLDSNTYPILKHSAKNNDGSKWKNKFPQNDSVNNLSPLIKRQNASETTDDKRSFFVSPSHNERFNKPSANNKKVKEELNPNCEKSRKITIPNIHKSQSKIGNKHTFGWTNKANKYLKRPGSVLKNENNNKKKIVNASDISNVTNDQKVRTNIIERTAACLKRKLDKSKIKEYSTSNQLSPIVVEKKICSEVSACSKLPIRIGNRRRSRNPMTRDQFDFKFVSKEENKEIEMKELKEDSCRLSSVRSRTKPKIKPSVRLDEAIDFIDTVKNFQSMESGGSNLENKNKVKNCLVDNLKAKSILIEDRVDNNSVGNVDTKENSSTLIDSSKNANLEINNIVGRNNEEMKILNVEEDQRKRTVTNRGREMNRKNGLTKEMVDGIARNGLKEKCCFRLNDEEGIACNDYYNKEHRNLDFFRSRKPTAIKSQF
ncbi:uncharacterized protein LOC122572475 [Bombus pyrosoma]|uniref:uncharacterized protein LOC122572475 n=1 Tax=Bombus pyrosoma TaxID=396416 RepID=UPI001CB99CD8|nr:uncharacterized protein LOC122572475 [Bombus pyrosoma]